MEAAKKLPRPFQKRKTIGVRISSHPILKALLPLLDAPWSLHHCTTKMNCWFTLQTLMNYYLIGMGR